MGSYRLLITPSAAKEIDKLPPRVRRRLIERIMRLADNPRPAGRKKLAGETHYRIRQGNYRVIYGVDDRQRMVDIIRVGHRREVYR